MESTLTLRPSQRVSKVQTTHEVLRIESEQEYSEKNHYLALPPTASACCRCSRDQDWPIGIHRVRITILSLDHLKEESLKSWTASKCPFFFWLGSSFFLFWDFNNCTAPPHPSMSSENASDVKQMIRTCVIIEARGQDNYTAHHTQWMDGYTGRRNTSKQRFASVLH